MGEGWREGVVREFGMRKYTLLYLIWITNKDLLDITWNSVQCCVATWIGEEFGGRMDACICMGEFFHGSPETITTCLLIGYTPVQNKKLKTRKNHDGHSKKKKKLNP